MNNKRERGHSKQERDVNVGAFVCEGLGWWEGVNSGGVAFHCI